MWIMPSIKELSEIFGSKSKAQEILFLLKNQKNVVRQGFYNYELPKVKKFCEENSIYLVKSKFKVLLADKGKKFSNKALRIPINDKRDGMYFIYLSKNEKNAYLASYYELAGNDCELGLLLNYPACCIDYFCENFSEKNYNPEIKSKNPYTDLSKRERDCVLISHFPCKADCEKSASLGKKYYSVILKHDKERAEEIKRILFL